MTGDWVVMAHSPALFPARVKSVTFGNATSSGIVVTSPRTSSNAVMDAEHGVSWGAWTASFAAGEPTATQGNAESTGGGIGSWWIEIRGLTCQNALEGTHDCRLQLMKSKPGGPGEWCMLLGGTFGSLNIPCPTDLRLQN